jgi:hypothetical protein
MNKPRSRQAKEAWSVTSEMHEIVDKLYEHLCDNEIADAESTALELMEELKYLLKNINDDFRD